MSIGGPVHHLEQAVCCIQSNSTTAPDLTPQHAVQGYQRLIDRLIDSHFAKSQGPVSHPQLELRNNWQAQRNRASHPANAALLCSRNCSAKLLEQRFSRECLLPTCIQAEIN